MNGKSPGEMIEEMSTSLQLGIGKAGKEMLQQYADLLLRGLQKQRLTGERTLEGLIGKQFYDSLYPLKVIRFTAESKILDLGTGGGLPGLPLKICLPDVNLYLLDSNKRKICFLKETAEAIGLKKIYFISSRAEELGQNKVHREQYDYVLCKAVAEMAVLAELSLPLLKVGGKAVLYKGPRGKDESKRAEKAINICGGEITAVWEYALKTGEQRSLFLLNKKTETPPLYPRAIGVPKRKPLR